MSGVLPPWGELEGASKSKDMEKKQYSTPTTEVMDLIASQMLAASGIRVMSDESGDEQLSGERRGGWGNLWGDEN